MLPGITPALSGGKLTTYGNDANTLILLHFDANALVFDSAAGHPGGRVWTNYNAGFTQNTTGLFNQSGTFPANVMLGTPATPDLDFGSKDYTIDFWAAPSVAQTVGFLGMYYGSGVAYSPWMFYQGGGFNFYFYASSNGTAWDIASALPVGSATGAGSWTHFAVMRKGNIFTPFCNGVANAGISNSGVNWPVGALGGTVEIGWQNVGSYWNGYLEEVRVSNIARYPLTGFTPQRSNYFGALTGGNDEATKLLLHCQGNATDVAKGAAYTAPPTSPHILNVSGGASFAGSGTGLHNQYLVLTGAAGCRLNTSLASVASDFDFGFGDFTIDFWYYRTGNSPGSLLLGKRNSGSSYAPWLITDTNGSLGFLGSQTLSSWTYNFTIGSVPLSAWTHVAVVRTGNNIQTYINGAAAGSYAIGNNYFNANNNDYFSIGGDGAGSVIGYMSEIRISNVARWTAPFLVPTAPYA
jgi:hypothetical protein